MMTRNIFDFNIGCVPEMHTPFYDPIYPLPLSVFPSNLCLLGYALELGPIQS